MPSVQPYPTLVRTREAEGQGVTFRTLAEAVDPDPPLERQRFYASHLGADRLGPFVTTRAAWVAMESERTNGSPWLERARVWPEWGPLSLDAEAVSR